MKLADFVVTLLDPDSGSLGSDVVMVKDAESGRLLTVKSVRFEPVEYVEGNAVSVGGTVWLEAEEC
jgi:hypothetical protein